MKICFVSIIVFCLSSFTTFYPQQKDRWLRGEVVFVKENNVQEKQKRTGIYIKESGDRDLTDNDGVFRIYLKDSLNTGDKISLGINKKGWEIQYPIYGEVYIPSNTDKELIKVKILPVGSPLFYTHDQISRFIEYSIQKNLKESSKNIGNQGNKIELDSTLKDWANHIGLSEKDVKDAFYKWLEEIYKIKDNFYEKGLAEYVKENYILAAEMFRKSSELKERFLGDLIADKKKIEAKEKSLQNEIIRDSRLAGEAFKKNKNFISAIEAYKKAIYYLEDNHDNELLVSTLNELALTYRLLSLQKADHTKLNFLDSANTFLSQASSIVNEYSIENWRLKIKANQESMLLENNSWIMFGEKNNVVKKALKTLYEIENQKRNDKTKNWVMERHNIGICYILLYQYTEELDSASIYLDSAFSSFNSINDSLIKKDSPISFAYININMANMLLYKVGFMINKLKMDHWLLKYMGLFNRNKNNIMNDCLNTSNDDENLNELDELINESISCAERAIVFFRENNREYELVSALNILADAKIKRLLYINHYISEKNISETIKLIDEAKILSKKIDFESERIWSLVHMGMINKIAMSQQDTLRIDLLTESADLLSKELEKMNYLPHIQTMIKSNVLLNYLTIVFITSDNELKVEFLNKAEYVLKDLLNVYSGIMDYRLIEESNYFNSLFNCFKKTL